MTVMRSCWSRSKRNRRAFRPAIQAFCLLATPMGFEPTISTVTGWHVNRYTTGPRAGDCNFLRPNSFYSRSNRRSTVVAYRAVSRYNTHKAT
jgi:hypothetical protein